MSFEYVQNGELRHTYPYGRHDIVINFDNGDNLAQRVQQAFEFDPQCRRVVVPVESGNQTLIAACEDAGLHYVLDVELRTHEELSLMVAEPHWVTEQSTDIKDLELK